MQTTRTEVKNYYSSLMCRPAITTIRLITRRPQLITKPPIVGQGKYAGGNINVKPLDFFDAVFLLPSGDVTMNEQ